MNVRLVASSPSVDCDESDYLKYRALMILILVFHVIGLPLAVFVFLMRYRHREERRLTIGRHSGPLVDFFLGPYKGSAFCELLLGRVWNDGSQIDMCVCVWNRLGGVCDQ